MDLSFLQDSGQYLQIPTDDVPDAFLNSPHQPPADTILADLLKHGHFRRAAEAALKELLECQPSDAKRIFELLYNRLACLVLISRLDFASHEAGPLIDFLARSPPGAEAVVLLIPWELRLLLVRLQSIAATDGGRRGIMSLYALAAEVRQHIHDAKLAKQNDQMELWSARLSDLGLRVADALVEMGELETATRHLDTLVGIEESEFAYRKALLRLRVGDLAGAQACIDQIQNEGRKASLAPLMQVAWGDITQAVDMWRGMEEADSTGGLTVTNLAVGLLYTGQIAQAKNLLEYLVQREPAFPGLLFNIATVYELCTERTMDRKAALVDSLAAREPRPDTGGFERANYEFKL